MENKKRIFIIENTELGSHLALSVYLTSLLEHYKNEKKYEWNLIIGKSLLKENHFKNINKIYETNTKLYKILDNLKFSFKTFNILRKENKINKINILHCLYPNSSLLGGVLFKIFHPKTKIIYDIRSPWIEMSFTRNHIKQSKKILKWILYLEEKILCKFVNSFIFISKGLRNYYNKQCNISSKNEICILPSSIDTSKFTFKKNDLRKELGFNKNDIIIGQIGGLFDLRRQNEFIHIFSKAYKENKNLKLIYVGGGESEKRMKKLVNKLSSNNIIRFLPKVSHDKIPEIISGFDYGLCHLPDIFVFRNSVPLKILEYLSIGIPVLASDIKAHNKLKKDFQKEIHIYKSEKDLIKLRQTPKNRNLMIENYSWVNAYKIYLEIYGGL